MSSAAPLEVGRLGAVPRTAAQTRVINAALDLFGRHGVSGTSLQMIADEMGVTKAAVYRQFKTKEEIVIAITEREMSKLEDVLEAAEAEAPGSQHANLSGPLVDAQHRAHPREPNGPAARGDIRQGRPHDAVQAARGIDPQQPLPRGDPAARVVRSHAPRRGDAPGAQQPPVQREPRDPRSSRRADESPDAPRTSRDVLHGPAGLAPHDAHGARPLVDPAQRPPDVAVLDAGNPCRAAGDRNTRRKRRAHESRRRAHASAPRIQGAHSKGPDEPNAPAGRRKVHEFSACPCGLAREQNEEAGNERGGTRVRHSSNYAADRRCGPGCSTQQLRRTVVGNPQREGSSCITHVGATPGRSW